MRAVEALGAKMGAISARLQYERDCLISKGFREVPKHRH